MQTETETWEEFIGHLSMMPKIVTSKVYSYGATPVPNTEVKVIRLAGPTEAIVKRVLQSKVMELFQSSPIAFIRVMPDVVSDDEFGEGYYSGYARIGVFTS